MKSQISNLKSRLTLCALLLALCALPASAAITRTAKGTAQNKGVSSLTLTGVSISAGTSIVVGITSDGGTNAAAGDVVWNGHNLSPDRYVEATGTAAFTEIWSLHNCPAETGSVVVNQGTTGAIAFFVTQLDFGAGVTGQFDKDAIAKGSGTSPSSGATATTTAADEILIGAVGTNGPNGDTAGTWSNSFNAGQRLGSTGGSGTTNETVSEGYLVVASTGTYTAAKTGITSRTWQAAIATYKASSGAPAATPKNMTLTGVGL
ncbi:MAG TPA: hypothetical protein VIW64_08845 [Pyrinomonadaceae bacterium]